MESLELHPCGSPDGMLLPCNLEQLNDRINNLSAGLIGMGDKDTIRVSRTFLNDVLNYMEELLGLRRAEENRRASPENDPLSLEQLKNMSGKAVVDFGGKDETTICLLGAEAKEVLAVLKKQVPMKPKTRVAQGRTEVRHHVFFGPGTMVYTCPVCGSFTTPTQRYCSECGQRFDWSESGRGGPR